jgi:hypothetical protein
MPLSSGARLGPYEIQTAIGAGGMGEVCKARDTRLDRTVAIKILPAELSAEPDRRTRFEREARAVAASPPSRDLWPLIATRGRAPLSWFWLDISVAATVTVVIVVFPSWLWFLADHL